MACALVAGLVDQRGGVGRPQERVGAVPWSRAADDTQRTDQRDLVSHETSSSELVQTSWSWMSHPWATPRAPAHHAQLLQHFASHASTCLGLDPIRNHGGAHALQCKHIYSCLIAILLRICETHHTTLLRICETQCGALLPWHACALAQAVWPRGQCKAVEKRESSSISFTFERRFIESYCVWSLCSQTRGL